MKRSVSVLFMLVVFFSLATAQTFSQQEALAQEKSECLREKWLLGDVITLDLESSQLTVNYVDHNTNQQKEITISVDEETRYENINSLQDIKVGDAVFIEYKISPEGEAIALNISIE